MELFAREGVAGRRAIPGDGSSPARVSTIAFFTKPVSSMISTPAGVAQMLEHVVAQIVTHRVDVPVRPPQQPLHPVRRDVTSLPGQSPAVREPKPATSPARYCRARRRDSERVNRPEIRACNRSSSADHRSTSAAVPASSTSRSSMRSAY